MSKLRFCFLHVLGYYVLMPLTLLGFRVAAKGRGLGRLRVGKLTVWGDSAFLDVCKSSIERMRTLDPALSQWLTERHWAWVYQNTQGGSGDAAPPRLFGINSSYLAWQADGIIARLVYVAFCISAFSELQASQPEDQIAHRRVMSSSRSWLETQGFPSELSDCYAVEN
jgi:hypothetical protein